MAGLATFRQVYSDVNLIDGDCPGIGEGLDTSLMACSVSWNVLEYRERQSGMRMTSGSWENKHSFATKWKFACATDYRQIRWHHHMPARNLLGTMATMQLRDCQRSFKQGKTEHFCHLPQKSQDRAPCHRCLVSYSTTG